MRVSADDTHTDRDTNRYYNLSHAICYSYGTDNKITPRNEYHCSRDHSELSDNSFIQCHDVR